MKRKLASIAARVKSIGLGEELGAKVASGVTLPDSDRKLRLLGYWLLCGLFVGFILWASIAPLESAARAMGVVQVDGNRKAIQHLEGGIVSKILISEGEYVTKDQALIQLDTARSLSELRRAEGRLWSKQALVDRLTSERDDLAEVVFSSILLRSDDPRAASAINNERTLFSARQADRYGELELIASRQDQYQKQVEGLGSVIRTKASVIKSIETELEDLNALLEDGFVDKQKIRTLERSLAETLGELADLEARLAMAQVSVLEAKLQGVQREKRFKTEVTDSLTLAHEQLYDLDQLRKALADRVKRSTIRAPVSGVVMDVQPNVPGAVIAPGQDLLAIVPDATKLVVSAKLSPMDIDRVVIGQEAELRFAVFKGSYTVTGELVKISADSLQDPMSGASYYSAKIELLERDLELLKGRQLVPGMPVEVLVKTGNRTLIAYLTSPLLRAFDNSLIEE